MRGELREPAGRFPAGTPDAADDRALLLWILATLVDSGLAVYQRYVRDLGRDERDAYWRDWRPRRIRRQYGFRWDPVRGIALRGHTEYAKRLLVPLLPARVRYADRRHLAAAARAAA